MPDTPDLRLIRLLDLAEHEHIVVTCQGRTDERES
jgi:hypothetical protein